MFEESEVFSVPEEGRKRNWPQFVMYFKLVVVFFSVVVMVRDKTYMAPRSWLTALEHHNMH